MEELEKPKPLSNAQRQKRYREKRKQDEQYKEVCDKYRKTYMEKQKETPEARRLLREKERVRKQIYRERKKLSKKKLSPQMMGKVANKIDSLLPYSPSTQIKVLNRVSKLKGVRLFPPEVGKPRRVTTEADREMARAFYNKDEISRVDPTFKNAKSSKDGMIASRRHLLYTIREAYSLFVQDNPELRMGKSTFATLRPNNVKPYKNIPQNVCICRYHENFETLLGKLKDKLQSFPQSVEDFFKVTRCNIEDYNCMSSNCPMCSEIFEDFFDLTRFAEHVTDSIKYRQWTFVNKHFEQVEIETNVQEALSSLKAQASPFYLHVFNQKTSQSYFRRMKDASSREKVVIQIDFAENYSCQYQDEIQSAHWSNPQVSLFTCVIWSGETTESVVIASDNISHDKFCVNVFLRRLITYHVEKNPNVREIVIVSDGCAGQFKNRYNFRNLPVLKKDFKLESLTWTFFATSHGKGAVDGIGSVVKRFVWNQVRSKKVIIRNAEDFVKLCTDGLNNQKLKTKVIFSSESEISNSKEAMENLWKNCLPVKGTHKFHNILVGNCDNTLEFKVYPQMEVGEHIKIYSEEDVNVDTVALEEREAHKGKSKETRKKRTAKRKKDISEESCDSDIDDPETIEIDKTSTEYLNLSKNFTVDLSENDYVIVIYEGEYYPGMVIGKEVDGFMVKTMIMAGIEHYKWPDRDDICLYKLDDIIMRIKPPNILNSRNQYHVPEIFAFRKK